MLECELRNETFDTSHDNSPVGVSPNKWMILFASFGAFLDILVSSGDRTNQLAKKSAFCQT